MSDIRSYLTETTEELRDLGNILQSSRRMLADPASIRVAETNR